MQQATAQVDASAILEALLGGGHVDADTVREVTETLADSDHLADGLAGLAATAEAISEASRSEAGDRIIAAYEGVFPWTVSDPLTPDEVYACLLAWQGYGESSEHEGGYRYLLHSRGAWFVIEVSENMGLCSVTRYSNCFTACQGYLFS